MSWGGRATLLLLALFLPGLAAQAATLAISAARLIDVSSGKDILQPVVLVEDERIIAVGPAGSVTVPAGARRIALPGLTLLPGLIDMHVHLTGDPTQGGFNSLLYTDSFWPVIGVRNANLTLQAGFTTVRNVGSDRFDDVGLRQAIDGHFIPGPRIVTATYAIGATGGHCDETYFPPSMQQSSPAVGDSPDDLRKRVRWLHKYGAQVIKICATGGVFDHGDRPGAQQLNFDEIKAIVDEAHMEGLRVAAHAHGTSGIRDSIRAGVDTIEHASLIDDEGIRLAKEKGAWLSMDIYNTDYTQSEGKRNGVLEESLKKDRDLGDVQRENFRKAVKAGVKMLFGSDAGVYPHGDNGKQFAVMVRYGMTPLQAIQAATVNAAQALDRERDIGVVAPGHFADLIAVAGDPLTDVTSLEHVIFVMKDGEVVKTPMPEEVPAAPGAPPPAGSRP